MILTKKQLNRLPQDTRIDLLDILYEIEDSLDYKCKDISKTIDYIQDNYIGKGVD